MASTMRIALFCLSLVLAFDALAQDPSAAPPVVPPDCRGTEFRQFDFWLGDWRVSSQDKHAGDNRIATELAGCLLVERWTGAGGLTGISLNHYRRELQRWQQTWVDSRGNTLVLQGGLLEPGVMQMHSLADAGGPRQRITWRRLDDGSVEQHWQQTGPDGEWQTAFLGLYQRRGSDGG